MRYVLLYFLNPSPAGAPLGVPCVVLLLEVPFYALALPFGHFRIIFSFYTLDEHYKHLHFVF
jgi:hypothetical protein